MKTPALRRHTAFTLVELLVVIAIIAILMAITIPAIGKVKDVAKKAQAKNDAVNLVTAVKAYYAEYGKYPDVAGTEIGKLMKILEAENLDQNPRKVIFFSGPVQKKNRAEGYGVNSENSKFYDPWGTPYGFAIDNGTANDTDAYDNKVKDPTGGNDIKAGAIAWSVGKDGQVGTDTDDNAKDDSYSWK